MKDHKHARLNFRLTRKEFDLVDKVIERLGHESKTSWLRAHIRADAIACGFDELSADEKALLAVMG